MYPLKLTARPGAWRLYAARRRDPAFKSYALRVFERDRYTCQYCGYCSHQYQEVVNLDLDYQNNKLKNLVTACSFCAQCFFLEAVGAGGYGGGLLVYLPEISQADLNGLCHVLFLAIVGNTGYKASANTIYRTLKTRSQLVEEEIGEGVSTPSVLGQLLIEAKTPEATVNKILSPLRLLPSRAHFREQIESEAREGSSDSVVETDED